MKKTPLPGIRVFRRGEGTYIAFWCPACCCIHGGMAISPQAAGPQWTWNGKTLTLHPSVRHFYDERKLGQPTGRQVTTCHYHVRGGRIEYCGDSPHALAGQSVALDQAPPENYGGREHFGWKP